MAAGMRIRILGNLEVRDDAGHPAVLGGHRQGALLAVLTLHHNEVVSVDRLIDDIWSGRPPATAAHTVQVFVSRLRRALGPARERISTCPPGYCLDVRGGELDAERCEDLYARGRAALAAGDPATAGELLREAQALWRGAPLAEFTYEPFAQAAIARLDELRLSTREELFEAELALGQHARVVAGLEALIREQPLRERPRGQLMLALYGSGRQADALSVFQETRRRFVDELAVEPGIELREIQHRILEQDPALSATSATVTFEVRPAPTASVEAACLPVPPRAPKAVEGAFVGREQCLAQLHASWQRCCAGELRLMVLEGEPGAGKTRLARRFADEVHADGGAVLYGRCDAEALVPYQPFVEAFEHLTRHSGPQLSATSQPELDIVRGLLPFGSGTDPPAELANQETARYRVFQAVVRLLRHAGDQWPLLLVLDDLHWADKPTLLLLRHVLRHADDGRLMILGIRRPGDTADGGLLDDLLMDVGRERDYDALSLAGLDQPAVRALVTDRLGVDATGGFVSQLQEVTKGNAFFIEQMVRALAGHESSASGVLSEDDLVRLGVPEDVKKFIASRARGLSPLTRTVLSAAAIAGAEFRLAILEQLVDAGWDPVVSSLEEAMTAGLVVEVPDAVDVFAFSHALVRKALYDGLSESRRVRLHHLVAQALERLAAREDVNPAELAHHFGLAVPIAGRAPALRYAIEAGRQAAESFAYEEAAAHYRASLALLDDEDTRCEVLLALGRVEWHAGDDAARDTFLEAADNAEARGDATQLARAALGLGERFFEVTYLGPRYRDLLEKAAATLPQDERALRALVLSRLGVTMGFPHQHERALRLTADAVATARELDDANLQVAVILARHIALLDAEHLDERLALGETLITLRGGHRELVAERHHWRLYDLLSAGELDAARAEQAGLETLADELGQPLFHSIALGARGLWAELAGDLTTAEGYAEQSLAHARQAHTQDALSSWASQRFAQLRRLGRLGELTPHVERLAASGGRALGWLAALGILRSVAGDADGARAIYDQELEAGPHGVPHGMFRLTRLALLSELCHTFGDKERADALYDVLLPFAHHNVVVAYCSFWGPVEAYLAMLAATLGDEARVARHAEAALWRARSYGAPLIARDIERRHGAVLARARGAGGARSEHLAGAAAQARG